MPKSKDSGHRGQGAAYRRITDIHLATPEEMLTIAQWLQEPLLWRDAFLLPTQPDLPFLQDGLLFTYGMQEVHMVEARFWAIRSLRTDNSSDLIGFVIDYPWGPRDRDIREIDAAFPGSDRRSRRLPMEVFSVVVDELFQQHGVNEVRVRTRGAGEGKGFQRLFAAMGCHVYKAAAARHASGQDVRRIHYRCTPESFAASPWGQRMQTQVD